MPRSNALNIEVDSDRDLRSLSCRRVSVTKTDEGRYLFTSRLLFWRCERHSFVNRLIRRRMPDLQTIAGQCSAPSGYFFNA